MLVCIRYAAYRQNMHSPPPPQTHHQKIGDIVAFQTFSFTISLLSRQLLSPKDGTNSPSRLVSPQFGGVPSQAKRYDEFRKIRKI